jgi:hypothetical protein
MPQNDTLEFLKKNVVVFVIALASGLFFIFALFQYFAPENIKPFKTAKSESSTNSKTVDSKQSETKTTDSNTKSETTPVTSNSTTNSTNTEPSTTTTTTQTSTPAPVTSTTTTTPKVETQTYTNPYFPNLKVVYDKSWKFSTSTQDSSVKGIVNRTIILNKGATSLKFELKPSLESGCGVPEDMKKPLLKNVKGSKFNRFDFGVGGDVYTSKSDTIYLSCPLSFINIVQSSISADDFPNPFYSKGQKYPFELIASVKGAQYLDEADQIIADSTLE